MDISLTSIHKSFMTPKGIIDIFKDLNLNINSGEFVSILGPNGCGKSTLLNLIMGLDKDYQGLININNIQGGISTNIAYMMQKDLLLPWKTVYQNIILGIEIQGKIGLNTYQDALEYLNHFGILNLIDAYPSKLSGGERQKVSLIRTLMLDSKIILLDEPFSAIDYNTRLELQAEFIELAKKKNKTILLITHDIDEAIIMSDRVIIFDYKPKGIIKDFKIVFNKIKRTPISVKQDSNYNLYFSRIWESLPKGINNES